MNDYPDKAAVGGRVRSLRLEQGISQVELAECAGVKPHTMYRYEVGKMGIGTEALSLIAERLGTTTRWLLWGDSPPGNRGADPTLSDEAEHPYPAWSAFLEILPTLPALGVDPPTEAELAELETKRWKTGNPVVKSYLNELETLRTLVPKHHLEAGHRRTEAAKARLAGKGARSVDFERGKGGQVGKTELGVGEEKLRTRKAKR